MTSPDSDGGVIETDLPPPATDARDLPRINRGRAPARRFPGRVLTGRVLVEFADDDSRHPRQIEQDDEALDGRRLLLMIDFA